MRKQIELLLLAGVVVGVVYHCSHWEFLSPAKAFAVEKPEVVIFNEAQQKFQLLHEWEQAGDWDSFFGHKDEYQSQIESAINSIHADKVLVVKAGYLAWKTALLFNSTSRVAFEELIATLNRVEGVGEEVLKAVEEVISDLHFMERTKLKNRVAVVYKELLLESGTPVLLSRQAEAFLNDGDVESAVSLYRSYIERLDGKEQLDEVLRLLPLFTDTGFNERSDAAFAEELFSILRVDPQILASEGFLYLRGYNAERLGDYAGAIESYERLLSDYQNSPLRDEVAFRSGCLMLFKMGKRDQAKLRLLEVRDCKVYDTVMPLSVLNETFVCDDYNFKSYIDAVNGVVPLLGRNFTTIATPHTKLIVDESIKFSALGFSSDTGCLVPQGLFLWSGDFGATQINTNSAEVLASYSTPGVRAVNLVQQGMEGAIGFDRVLIEVYDFEIESAAVANIGKPVLMSANINPPLPLDLVEVEWRVDTILQQGGASTSLEVTFDQSGTHKISATLRYFGMEVAKTTVAIDVSSVVSGNDDKKQR